MTSSKISDFFRLPRDQRIERATRAIATVAEAEQQANMAIDPETLALAKIGRRIKAERAEHERVRALIIRDAEERDRNERRVKARREFEEGRFVNLDDTRDTLPQEQLAADEFEPVTVFLPAETVRENSTVWRVSRIKALWRRGVLEDHEMAACSWYRDQWDLSGLDPLVSSTFEPKYGNGGAAFGHMPRTPEQLEARDNFRFMEGAIDADVRDLVNAVVLHDMVFEDAGRLVRVRKEQVTLLFRRGVLKLYEAAYPQMPTTRVKWD